MTYLGIDYGLKKIGLAISEGQIASPLKVINIKSLNDGLEKISQIIEQEKIDRVVIGVSEGATGKMIKKFVQTMDIKYAQEPIEIIAFDETLTSHDAIELMIKLNVPRNKRKLEDAYSAALILQSFLNTLN